VLVAGYSDIDGTAKDFESLGALVRDAPGSIDVVIVVTHIPDGSVAVRRAATLVARRWGGAAGPGLAVGLFAPPLLASLAVGAVAGGVIGKFVEQNFHDHPDS
jgi:uncharacterized membrane protein